MDKLAILDDLIAKIHIGEVVLEADTRVQYEKALRELRGLVKKDLREEIVRDITDLHTEYYAPEHDSWKAFLNHCNGGSDYAAVLEEFDESELENLWQNSHIPEEMNEAEIRADMMCQIGKLKMLSIVNRDFDCTDHDKANEMISGIVARIKGLYNMLYE